LLAAVQCFLSVAVIRTEASRTRGHLQTSVTIPAMII
jgi:hypothetical protein